MEKYQKNELLKLKDCVQSRFEGWKSKLLSKAGTTMLIKLVLQAIMVYTMSTFKIPKGICERLDATIRHFWWGSKECSNIFIVLKS